MKSEVVAMLEDGFFDPRKPFHIRRGDLPHWRQDGALYFVTFRLSDSLPELKLAAWRREESQWRYSNPSATYEELEKRNMNVRIRMERWLDRGTGSCVLRRPHVKTIVERAIRHFDEDRYELGDIAIAANHVHVLVRAALGNDLSKILHSWKRRSARDIRPLVGIGEKLWQTESFDHIVRNRESLERFSAYIRNHETGVQLSDFSLDDNACGQETVNPAHT